MAHNKLRIWKCNIILYLHASFLFYTGSGIFTGPRLVVPWRRWMSCSLVETMTRHWRLKGSVPLKNLGHKWSLSFLIYQRLVSLKHSYSSYLDFSKSSNTCLGKILLAHSAGKNGKKWKGYFFVVFTLPVSQYMFIMSKVHLLISRHRKSWCKLKPRPLSAMKAEKSALNPLVPKGSPFDE